MKTAIISDLHLGSRICRIDMLESFLSDPFWDNLIINGDMIDSVNLERWELSHWRVLNKLVQLNPTVIAGNHDSGKSNNYMFINKFFTTINHHIMQLGNKRYYITHGDIFDPFLNWKKAAATVEGIYVASQYISSRLSCWLKRRSKRMLKIVDTIVNSAAEVAITNNCGGVILGHTHIAESSFVIVRDSNIHYLNSGCWTDSDFPTYLIGDENDIQLKLYKPK